MAASKSTHAATRVAERPDTTSPAETPTTTSPTSPPVDPDATGPSAGSPEQLPDELRRQLEVQRDAHNDPLGLRDEG